LQEASGIDKHTRSDRCDEHHRDEHDECTYPYLTSIVSVEHGFVRLPGIGQTLSKKDRG